MAIPNVFAVPRVSLFGDSHHFQIFSYYNNELIPENYENEEFHCFDRYVSSRIRDVCINTREGRHHREVFWDLPFYFQSANVTIPIIDFHLSSWIPRGGRKFSMGSSADEVDIIVKTTLTLRSEKAGELAFITPPTTPIAEIPSAPIRPPRGSPSDTFEIPASLLEAFDYEDAEDQPLQTNQSSHVPSIPRHVIDMIIDHKKRSGDSCSISTTPFADCEHLSVTMPCCHVFDRDSLKQWIETKNECPECRTALSHTIDV